MKNIIFLLFILLCAAQLFVPAQMAWSAKDVLVNGEVFKFKTIPVDPNDPFRGKYITLRFTEQIYTLDTLTWNDWQRNETFYASLGLDAAGFATIDYLSPYSFTSEKSYLVVKKKYATTYKDSVSIQLQFPFERFYLEENKAPIAERIFRDANRTAREQTYALVRIKDGEAVLEDVRIGEQSLRDLAQEELQRTNIKPTK